MAYATWIKVPFLFVLFLIFFSVNAQSHFPARLGYDSLQTVAKAQGKMMFMMVHQRDEAFEPLKTPVSKKTRSYMEEKFVSGIIQVEREDIQHPLAKAFYLTTPVLIFADSEGYPILRYNLPIKDEKTLLHLADSAYILAKGETLGKLVKEYQKGKRNQALLRKILTQYQDFDYYTDQRVLNEYLGQLTIQELNNFETVVFLLKSGPVYNSSIYKLARTNGKMVDSLYASLPLPTRIDINRRIIRQTFRHALETSNFYLTQELQQFVRGTWSSNYLRSQISGSYYPMEYKRLMKDTVGYVSMARNYYNANYYRVSPDSLASVDYAVDQKIKVSRYQWRLNRVQRFEFQDWYEKHRTRYNQEQARYLSQGARQILAFSGENTDALYDAVRWQRKAIEQYPGRGQYHYTLAMLLYKLGFSAQAKTELQRAKELYKLNPVKQREIKVLLKQIK